ncbi:MAG: NADP-dependent malic enzyme [Deltaproteobacteria bacterium]|nr:NADP-dependent malic enzyme [Deltaproteobacteria bacterium]
MKLKLDLSNLSELLPPHLNDRQRADLQTRFLKNLSIEMHRYYGGKMQTLPKVGIWSSSWFNIWYTPGVSRVSTTIRDDHETSFDLSNRGNLVAIVSDSSRVLGDGDCTSSGGLGVMEGKALLMKYLGGVDAVSLCIDNRDPTGAPCPEKLIQFVRMIEPSFGAVNLEDISQPNCYRVLDELQQTCRIPVWHDDAQGTACVTLAGLLNALKVTGKELCAVKVVLLGSGAANSTVAKLLLKSGMPGCNITIFNSGGGLHRDRSDISSNPKFYRQWELCQLTNPDKITAIEDALPKADVLIALSKPGPDTIKPCWIASMRPSAIVFACANPVPEIYPYAAKEAGAAVVATGRSDFPNQINNSLGFPGILKGTLMARAARITDEMAICAAHTIAAFAARRGLHPDYIVPNMEDYDVFPEIAASVCVQAQKDGVAKKILTYDQAYQLAKNGIISAQNSLNALEENGLIQAPHEDLLKQVLEETLKEK